VFAAFPLAAGAAGPQLPGASSAIRQYIEMIPTASGSVAAGSGTSEAAIPAATQKRIDRKGGANTDLLVKVATSGAYGAPAQFSPTPATSLVETPVTPRVKPAKRVTPARTAKPKQVKPHPAPPVHRVAAPVAIPRAPGALSAASGSFGTGGLLFALVLAAALGLVALPLLSQR
jgi:hypothetical protein